MIELSSFFTSHDKFLTRVPHFKVRIVGIHVAVLAPWFRDYIILVQNLVWLIMETHEATPKTFRYNLGSSNRLSVGLTFSIHCFGRYSCSNSESHKT